MTGNSKPGKLGLLGGFGRCVLFAAVTVVLLSAGLAAKAQTAAEQEICNLVKTYCRKVDGVQINAAICQSAKKQRRTYGYSCGRKRPQKTAGPKACRGYVGGDRGAVVSLSVDAKNPKIFGYCVKGTGPEARQCAYQACVEKGGRSCDLPCNPLTGREIRACRAEVVTIIVAKDFARLGCGRRYVENGSYTFESYVNRELNRCRRNSKSPSTCRLEAGWR